MEQAKSLVITPRYNSVSEMTFSLYKEYNGVEIPYYSKVVKNRTVHVEGLGWFIIYQVTENYDGGVPSKDVSCYSYEYTLNYKGINILDGTFNFYALTEDTGIEESLMYQLFSIVPNWKIGHISTELIGKYRTFDVPDGTLYGFLMDEVASTYECIFEFDTENLIINAYTASEVMGDNSSKRTNIILTFDNVLKSITIEELSTDICTCLSVNGADNLSINVVNPLGDDKLYDFSYYMNEEWIGAPNDSGIDGMALIDKITKWQELIDELTPEYTDGLTDYRSANYKYLQFKANAVTYQAKIDAAEIVRKNLAGSTLDTDVAEFQRQTSIVNENTALKNTETANATAKYEEMNNILAELTAINDQVKFTKYFTQEEQVYLSNFIIESTYTDDNFVVTDDMIIPADFSADTLVLTTTGVKKWSEFSEETDVLIDEQYIANQLLEEGKSVMAQVAQPSFSFSLESTNFLFNEKFLPFIKQIEMGCLIYVEVEEGYWVNPILMEMTIDYDSASLSMTFGNRFRLSDSEWTFAELHNETVKTTSQVGSTLQIASEPVLNGTINTVKEYMNNNLIAANQQIQSTVDNEITIGNFGLRGRKLNESDSTGYDRHELWVSNNLICMTDDHWNTTKLAIGFIKGGKVSGTLDGDVYYDEDYDGSEIDDNDNGAYCVNADIIAGTLLAGQNLTISNTGGTFTVDGAGATMVNGNISVKKTTTDAAGKETVVSAITLNPETGFSIYNGDTTSSDNRVFYADTDGNLHFKGDLTGATGKFSGSIEGGEIYIPSKTNAQFSVDKDGNMTANSGTFKGKLDGATGTFSGNLDAAGGTFSGTISANQIKSGTLDCDSLTVNGLSFEDISDNLTSDQMSAIKINANQITAGKITASQIDTTTLSVSKISAGNASVYCSGNNTITIQPGEAGTITIGSPASKLDMTKPTVTMTTATVSDLTCSSITLGTVEITYWGQIIEWNKSAIQKYALEVCEAK
jgi:hypothetical protein